MKKILVWSIQHTGTFFCIEALAAGTKEENRITGFGSFFNRHRRLGRKIYLDLDIFSFGRSPPPSLEWLMREHVDYAMEDFTDYFPIKDGPASIGWYDRCILDLAKSHPNLKATEEKAVGKIDWNKISLFVAHDHYHRAKNTLWQSLTQYKPEFSVVIPMRDPLLSLHSKNWREVEKYHNNEQMTNEVREKRVRAWVRKYLDQLSVPKEHVFILPIDQENSEESRIITFQKLYKYCGLTYNETVQRAAVEWRVRNSTRQIIDELPDKKNPQASHWARFGERYNARDLGFVNKFMGLELAHLKKQKVLKAKLQEIGYKDLLWW